MMIVRLDHSFGDTPYFIHARQIARALPISRIQINANTNEAEYIVEAEHNPGSNIYGGTSYQYLNDRELFKSETEAKQKWIAQFPDDEITKYTFPWTWDIPKEPHDI